MHRKPMAIRATILLVMVCLMGKAQIYFNKRIDFYGRANMAFTITKKDNGHYYIHGETNDSLTSVEKNTICLIDSAGNVLMKKAVNPGSTTLYYPTYSSSSVLDSISNIIYTPVTASYTYGCQYAAIIEYNLSGDTQKIFTFGDTAHITASGKLHKIKNGWLYATSMGPKHSPYNYKMKLFALDSLFNVKWSNLYGPNGFGNVCTDMLRYNNGDNFLVGYQNTISSSLQSTILVKTDSLGNQKWIKYYSNVWYKGPTITKLQDGNLLISTTYLDSMSFNFASQYTQTNLIKIDTAGNVIWSKLYQYPTNLNFAAKCIELTDKSLIILTTEGGWTGSNCATQRVIAVIMKTDSMGNQIFYHTYTGDAYDITAYNYLFDIVQMPDKGFLATGFVAPNCDGTSWDAWILRVDSMGCEFQRGCALFTGINGNYENSLQLEAFPNPTSGVLTVNYQINGPACDAATLQLYELSTGRILLAKSVPCDETQTTFDLKELPPGIFALSIRSDGSAPRTIRIVKIQQ